MIFSSIIFVSVFFTITFIVYFICPGIKVKNGILIISSLLFYTYGEGRFVFVLLLSVFINWLAALFIEKGKFKKLILVISLILNFGLLFYYKYFIFTISGIASLLGKELSLNDIRLPIGISFFTFQAVSYVIDVYKDTVEAQKSYFKLLLYISFFPQLIAGPIIRYRDIDTMLYDRTSDIDSIADGFRRFICGLSKKVLIANTMALCCDKIFSANALSGGKIGALAAWIGAIAYMFQIYYDFSGYSDMAIGLGKMFGFTFAENFNYPYGALGIKDFWRKWHISLSTWFKEYLYIPLGGNRKGRPRTVINKIIVFLLTGLWHGANLTFILWGAFHGFFLLIEEYVPITKKLPGWLIHIYTFIVVCTGFVIFRADTVLDGFRMITAMFTGFSISSYGLSLALSTLTPLLIFTFIVAFIGIAPVKVYADQMRVSVRARNYHSIMWLNLGAFLLLLLCMLRLSGGAYNPFIYFRF